MIKNIKVSPSMLDAFCNVLTGKYNETEARLLDKINKVAEYQQTEAMRKGIAFHALTDGSITPNYDWKKEIYSIEWFEYPKEVTERVCKERKDMWHEQWVSRPIETKYGTVLTYGKVDDIGYNHVQDLKTAGQYYTVGHDDSNQWRFYLYGTKAQRFTYLITDFTCVYYEEYFWYPDIEVLLRKRIEKYCEFLNDNINKINPQFVTYGERPPLL